MVANYCGDRIRRKQHLSAIVSSKEHQFIEPFLTYLDSKDRGKPIPPKSNGFMAHADPMLMQEILDVANAKAETELTSSRLGK